MQLATWVRPKFGYRLAYEGIANLLASIAEEIEKASTVIPKSMVASVALNGSLGFAMVIATLFCLGNAKDAINSPTGFPFIEVFLNATGSKGGATAMVCSKAFEN